MVATAALREALNQGISSGNFIDTKIILYSCRDSSGRVCRPKALYANSHLLKSIPYFDVQSQPQCFDEKIDEEEHAEGYEYLSDSDLEDEDETVVPPSNTSGPKPQQLDLPAAPGDGPGCEDYKECIQKGRVIKIWDVAFVTFHAFLVYIYTGKIEFAQFGSEEDNKLRSLEVVNPSDDVVPLPSPKSIYRLADKYDVPVLRNLALDHIRGQLAKRDIVEESFSRFASRYDEIRDACIENLAYMLIEDSTMETTRAGVRKKIDSFAEGELDHATEMLTTLWETVAKNRNIKAPINPPSTNAPVANPDRWDSVKTALARSIRKGVFFDKKYWVRHSRARDILKPIYFPGAIMDDKAEQLRKWGRNSVIASLEC